MKGIEKITARITQEAQAEIDRTLADAREQAAQITARYQAQADAEAASLAARNEKAAAEREERLVSVAQMEARKVALAAKQEMVEQVYRRALEKLRSMPQEQYTAVLAALLVQASSTGAEEVVFSPEDQAKAGKAAVAKAAIPQADLVYVDGEDLMEVSSYYEVLFAADPTSIGGAIPDDAFYYIP